MIRTFNQIYREYVDKFEDDREVLFFNGTIVKKGEFVLRVEELVGWLSELGIKQGDGVGYTLYNGTDIIPLFIAIAKIGAYAIPQFAGLPAVMKMKLFKQGEAKLIITNEDMVEGLIEEAEKEEISVQYAVVEPSSKYVSIAGAPKTKVEPKESYITGEENELSLMIASSSGTTGIPKMVCMTQQNVGAEMLASFDMSDHNLSQPKKDIGGVAFPISTSVMLVICGMLFHGRALVFSDDLSPMTFLKNVERYKVTSLSCPPAYFESLLLLEDKMDYDLSSVVEIGAGMDFFPQERLRRLMHMFPNLRVFTNGYGLVETCNIFTYGSYDITGEDIEKTATLNMSETSENIMEIRDESGTPVSVGEVGELFIKGPNVVKGYMKAPDVMMEAFQDGWFRTGDIARKESDTRLTLLGRRKYFIKRGGKSISPIVVQSEINKTEGVVDSGVVGVPHPLYGEMIWAFVVKDEHSDVSLKEIKRQCRKNLPFYMLPDQITFVDQVPKNPGVGKVSFETLRKMGEEELKKIELH